MAGSESPQSSYAKRYKITGQICEVTSVVLFAWGALWIYFNLDDGQKSKPDFLSWFLPILILLAAGFFFFFAIRLSVALAEESARLARGVKYKVTPQRLETLQEAKVPRDVLHYLRKIISNDLMEEEVFFAKLKDNLGPERAGEVKAVVLKYTRVYESDEAPAEGNSAEPPTPAPKEA